MQRLGNPYPVFFDQTGALAYDNKVYIGEANADPQVDPIVVYWDSALTQVAMQPLVTIGGRIVNGATPADVFFAEENYSLRQLDPFDALVYYSPSVIDVGTAYQPLNASLTAIAEQGTTDYGNRILTLPNAAYAEAYFGYTPFSGGVITSTIIRADSGAHTYFSDSALNSGRIFVTASGASDPTSLNGDIWLELE